MGLRFNIGNNFSFPLDTERIGELTASVEYSENISALKLLVFTGFNTMGVADHRTLKGSQVRGIAITAGDQDDYGDVVLFGNVSDPNFNFPTVGATVYLGENANISVAPPASGYWMPVGSVLNTTSIFFDPTKFPIKIA